MIAVMDRQIAWLVGGVVALLVVASAAGAVMRRRATNPKGLATIDNFNARTRSWWGMAGVFLVACLGGLGPTLLLFALISLMALREFITLVPTRHGDHRALVWVFFVLVPLQSLLLYYGQVGMFLVLIPVYSFLLLSFRSAVVGDTTDYLRRVATVFWAAMICVFCLGHAPALLLLHVPNYAGQNVKLLFFLVIVAQLDDVFQYCWGKLLGRHKLSPKVSPNKTWEGFLGGLFSSALVGLALTPITPFRAWQAAGLALTIALLGTMGGIVMSAIKRDVGVKDYGQLIDGHGGIMDRVDSLAFAAPVFFHVVRYWFERN